MTAKIYHADLWGARAHKYAVLAEQTITSVPWTEVIPTAPAYLFVPQNQDVREEYEQGWSVKDIFPVNTVGIVTGQDKNTVAFTEIEAETLAATLGLPAGVVRSILYRPFDTRFIVYDKKVVTRQRLSVMQQMFSGKNLALITVRKTPPTVECNYFSVTRDIIVNGAIRSDNQSIDVILPLYLYPEKNSLDTETRANFAPAFVTELTERIGRAATPEDTFHYFYAVLHSPTYRQRYGEFLKRDFPRIPLPPDAETFEMGAEVGKKLVAAHLLEDPALLSHAPGFPLAGTNVVDKMKPDKRYRAAGNGPHPPNPPLPQAGEGGAGGEEGGREGEEGRGDLAPTKDAGPHNVGAGSPRPFPPPPHPFSDAASEISDAASQTTGRVYLNDVQYFDTVAPDVWNFRVGGYQPAAKWLDDRAGRTLTDADLTHYRALLAAQRVTLALLPAADAIFARVLQDAPAAR